MNFGSFLAVIGMTADATTTIMGLGLHFAEDNILGVKAILIGFPILLLAVFLCDKLIYENRKMKVLHAAMTIGLMGVGIFRLYIAYLNYKSITMGMRI